MPDLELSCKELTTLVTDYLEGRMGVADVERFELHLSICPGCVSYVEQLRTTIDWMGRLPRLELSTNLERALLQAFRGWKRPSS